ncbi:hypothetical protein HAX54_019919 [Datura stramonium]|uniref:Uncharacterized protein n=1 Tax=Datura stramonium TaxID=4076 RepID=A0ABS8S4C2_DATST|nr:hypothetical protein [Datura stramonium]
MEEDEHDEERCQYPSEFVSSATGSGEKASERSLSQPINLYLPARVCLNNENGADRASETSSSSRSISGTNTMLQNEATSGFGPVRTMTYAARSSRIIYRRPESRLIVMVPYISGNNYFFDGSPAILFANGINLAGSPSFFLLDSSGNANKYTGSRRACYYFLCTITIFFMELEL